MNPRTLHGAIVAITLLSSAAQSQERWQSHASIRQLAHDFMTSKGHEIYQNAAEVEVGALDRRLRLAACPQALRAYLPPGGRTVGNTTVGIRCEGPRPWSLYVPVKIRVYREVLTTTRPLSRGERLAAGDLRPVRRDIASLRGGYLTDPTQALGRVVRRRLASDTVLSAAVIESPILVKRGQDVTLVSETGSIRVQIRGKALMDGASGDRIRVRNPRSKRIVEGTVVSAGVVRVNM
jgi:flagella basal body P-ring formation protein FlgA